MNRRPLYVSLLASLLVVGALAVSLLVGNVPERGLDLAGGVSVIYTPVLQEGEERPDDFDEVLDQTVEVIRSRVDSLGVAEPEITRQGDEILVQLPGVTDGDRVQEIVGRTAKLTFRRVEAELFPGDPGYDETPACDGEEEQPLLGDDEGGLVCAAAPGVVPTEDGSDLGFAKYRVGPAEIQGSSIEQAFPSPQGAGWGVSLELDDDGAEAFQQVTAELACVRDGLAPDGSPVAAEGADPGTGRFAIVLDGRVDSAPGINQSIACGEGISGGSAFINVGDQQEAEDLSLVLRTGALPVTLVNQDFRTVSPTLGAESLRAGLLAAAIGLVLVAIYLIAFYRWLGVVAIAALGVFGVLITGVIGLMGAFGFTLTLAGIAGIVVAIGITADSSILFFERIRDEVRLGKTVRTAVQRAFRSAFRTNLAGNTVTLAAAVILYFLAVGPVRGFALTLGIATILDILILWGFTRPVVFLMSTTSLLRRESLRVESPTPTRARHAEEVAP